MVSVSEAEGEGTGAKLSPASENPSRQTPQAVTELIAKQRAILAGASRLVKAGGRLVYATCSLLDEENRGVVEDFLSSHPDFVRVPVNELLAAARIELDTGIDLELRPDAHGTDGFYAAVLERRGADDKKEDKSEE